MATQSRNRERRITNLKRLPLGSYLVTATEEEINRMPTNFMTFVREPDGATVYLDPRRVTHIDTEYASDVRDDALKDKRLMTRIHTPDGHWVTVAETPAEIAARIDKWLHGQGQA